MQAYGTERLDEEVSAAFPSARVGRLDRDTSGVVLVAKHRPTLTTLARAMAELKDEMQMSVGLDATHESGSRGYAPGRGA